MNTVFSLIANEVNRAAFGLYANRCLFWIRTWAPPAPRIVQIALCFRLWLNKFLRPYNPWSLGQLLKWKWNRARRAATSSPSSQTKSKLAWDCEESTCFWGLPKKTICSPIPAFRKTNSVRELGFALYQNLQTQNQRKPIGVNGGDKHKIDFIEVFMGGYISFHNWYIAVLSFQFYKVFYPFYLLFNYFFDVFCFLIPNKCCRWQNLSAALKNSWFFLRFSFSFSRCFFHSQELFLE